MQPRPAVSNLPESVLLFRSDHHTVAAVERVLAELGQVDAVNLQARSLRARAPTRPVSVPQSAGPSRALLTAYLQLGVARKRRCQLHARHRRWPCDRSSLLLLLLLLSHAAGVLRPVLADRAAFVVVVVHVRARRRRRKVESENRRSRHPLTSLHTFKEQASPD